MTTKTKPKASAKPKNNGSPQASRSAKSSKESSAGKVTKPAAKQCADSVRADRTNPDEDQRRTIEGTAEGVARLDRQIEPNAGVSPSGFFRRSGYAEALTVA